MEQRFEFEGAEVRALLDESHGARERLMTEAQRYVAAGVDLHAGTADGLEDAVEHPGTGAPPGLWLMNDRGVYLRSNAGQRPGERVAHARGFRAEVAVGDEPMCEFVDAALLEQLRAGDTLVVTLSEQKIRLSLIRPE
ncbi:MAG: hypothetical protein ABW277_21935 [Longimicrobiaceae bacterium]